MDVPATATVHRAVYHTNANASVYHSLQHARPRRKEENRADLYAAVNPKRNLTHSLTHSLTGTLDRPRVIAPSKEPALDQCIILLKLLTDTKHRAAFLRQQDWSNGPFLSFARYQTYL